MLQVLGEGVMFGSGVVGGAVDAALKVGSPMVLILDVNIGAHL